MNVKIEISVDEPAMAEVPGIDQVISMRIDKQVAILDALTAEIKKAKEKKSLLEEIVRAASSPQSV